MMTREDEMCRREHDCHVACRLKLCVYTLSLHRNQSKPLNLTDPSCNYCIILHIFDFLGLKDKFLP